VYGGSPENAGELNYLLTMTVSDYLFAKKHSYQTFNDVIGVLECMKQELYRRLIGPYEDTKIKENGDVF
jgi:broad-specificity NMP kinase